MKFSLQHDLHCHTYLSSCCADPAMTPEMIYQRAKRQGLTVQCITDHLWDADVPGSSDWYKPQDIAHVEKNKAALASLPKEGPRMCFGCETEYCGGGKLGLAPEHFDRFDWIVIPPNHFHMKNFTRMAEVDTEEKAAELFLQRLEEISRLELPWHKIGIAHLNCRHTFKEGDYAKVFALMDEMRLRAVFEIFASRGAGIELNTSGFADGWEERREEHLRLFRIARDAGCRFYLGSDAHSPEAMEVMQARAARVITLLELTEEQRFQL